MNYEEALLKVKNYQYLLNKEITEKSTGLKSIVSYVTILPDEGIKVYNNDWLHPLNKVFAKFLSDKNCEIFFIVDFTKAHNSGISITEKSLKDNYLLPE